LSLLQEINIDDEIPIELEASSFQSREVLIPDDISDGDLNSIGFDELEKQTIPDIDFTITQQDDSEDNENCKDDDNSDGEPSNKKLKTVLTLPTESYLAPLELKGGAHSAPRV
uniref:Uncharacterized protein n=1 Tax=Clytia hemisphaerica TaxID=252671 RepID=A0A7M5XJF4_9CNID